MTADIESNNQQMRDPIKSSLLIDKYFMLFGDYLKFINYGKTPYKAAQVIQKSHNVSLASGIYIDAWK